MLNLTWLKRMVFVGKKTEEIVGVVKRLEEKLAPFDLLRVCELVDEVESLREFRDRTLREPAVPIVKLVDGALLHLWYADETQSEGRTKEARDWRFMATSLMVFLYSEVGRGGPLLPYRGIFAPQYWIDYMEFRRDKFIHPKVEVADAGRNAGEVHQGQDQRVYDQAGGGPRLEAGHRRSLGAGQLRGHRAAYLREEDRGDDPGPGPDDLLRRQDEEGNAPGE